MGWKILTISTHTPLTGRDDLQNYHVNIMYSISTHTPLTGRDIGVGKGGIWDGISTHTPLTGRDFNQIGILRNAKHFYSHAPYGT